MGFPAKTSSIRFVDRRNFAISWRRLSPAMCPRIVSSRAQRTISEADLTELKAVFEVFIETILGLQTEEVASESNDAYKKAIDLLLQMRLDAKNNKDWATSDKIRNELTALGFTIKDTKDGFEWNL